MNDSRTELSDKNLGLGVDTEDIHRFEALDPKRHMAFLRKVYSVEELDDCFSKPYPAQHLAGKFCAKEAVIKALDQLGCSPCAYRDVRVCHTSQGNPEIYVACRPNVRLRVSISHSRTQAVAIAMAECAV